MKAVILVIGILCGCGSVQMHSGTMKGYCFEAKGIGERCYKEMAECRSHESVLIEDRPWHVVEESCRIAFYE